MWKSVVTGLWLLLMISVAAANPLILSAPPRENPEKGAEQYKPIANFLTNLLGKPVVYQHPNSWLSYQRDMRADKYDIVFDGPHFVSWRIKHLGHNALIKLPGKLQFYLVSHKNVPEIKTSNDLIGKHIYGVLSPNLSTLSVLAHFDNPVRQPIIRGIKGGMWKVYAAFKQDQNSAAILRTTFYHKKLTQKDRQQMNILYTSEPLTNQAITTSKRINKAEQEKIRYGFLKTKSGRMALKRILKRFGGNAKGFIRANNSEYKGDNLLLEGVIFGW